VIWSRTDSGSTESERAMQISGLQERFATEVASQFDDLQPLKERRLQAALCEARKAMARARVAGALYQPVQQVLTRLIRIGDPRYALEACLGVARLTGLYEELSGLDSYRTKEVRLELRTLPRDHGGPWIEIRFAEHATTVRICGPGMTDPPIWKLEPGAAASARHLFEGSDPR